MHFSPSENWADSTSPCLINSMMQWLLFIIYRKACRRNFSARAPTQTIAGQMKVIIVPHDAHPLRGTNDVPRDAYCKKLDGAFWTFTVATNAKDAQKFRRVEYC